MRRFLKILFAFVLLGASAAAATAMFALWWLQEPLQIKTHPQAAVLEIQAGSSPKAVAEAVVRSGVEADAWMLYAWFRLSGQDRLIRAGNYEISAGTTPRALLEKLVRGEQTLETITFVEGWTFAQIRASLEQQASEGGVDSDTANMTQEQIMEALGKSGVAPEGRFFPDTYTYAKGSSTLAILRRSLEAMDRHLESAWSQRQDDLPLKTPEEALILASIIEKETGLESDRSTISGVFINRLRRGMLLQTDPSVIYGMGAKYQEQGGRIRKKDLQTDTPWNTYTRAGLPPTPIAMPGLASLMAAVQPAKTDALYFVARGDGSSEFSRTLQEHNRAVNRYIRSGGK